MKNFISLITQMAGVINLDEGSENLTIDNNQIINSSPAFGLWSFSSTNCGGGKFGLALGLLIHCNLSYSQTANVGYICKYS